MKFIYATNCTVANGEAINNMKDDARNITRRTFLKYVDRDSLAELGQQLGYALHPSQGLTMAGDYHVGYDRSRFQGKPCIFLTWSGIEYVFIQQSEPT